MAVRRPDVPALRRGRGGRRDDRGDHARLRRGTAAALDLFRAAGGGVGAVRLVLAGPDARVLRAAADLPVAPGVVATRRPRHGGGGAARDRRGRTPRAEGGPRGPPPGG